MVNRNSAIGLLVVAVLYAFLLVPFAFAVSLSAPVAGSAVLLVATAGIYYVARRLDLVGS